MHTGVCMGASKLIMLWCNLSRLNFTCTNAKQNHHLYLVNNLQVHEKWTRDEKMPSQHHANETASSTSNDEKGKKFETFLGRATWCLLVANNFYNCTCNPLTKSFSLESSTVFMNLSIKFHKFFNQLTKNIAKSLGVQSQDFIHNFNVVKWS
jgi:hypothetical protein